MSCDLMPVDIICSSAVYCCLSSFIVMHCIIMDGVCYISQCKIYFFLAWFVIFCITLYIYAKHCWSVNWKSDICVFASDSDLGMWLFCDVQFYTFSLGVARYMYFLPNHHGTASRFGAWGLTTNTGNSPTPHPHPEGGARSNATLFDNRQQNNSECRELRTWKQSPLDSDHVRILNVSLTWTDEDMRSQLFVK